MKRSVLIFIASVLLVLVSIPAINLATAPKLDSSKIWKKSFLYNMDFISRWTAELLYPFGISTNPKQVIIGKDGWLYLGDSYADTVSDDRRQASEADFENGKNIGAASDAWAAYLAEKGVKAFRVMVGPNKGTVYPEYMPSWAKPATPNPTDALFAGTGKERYIDLRGPLHAARQAHSEPLYYKTDTHWNAIGAGIGFQAFAKRVAIDNPEIHWPSDDAYDLYKTQQQPGGDLANFLRMTAQLPDTEPTIKAARIALKTTRTEFYTQKILYQGGNPIAGLPQKPTLFTSEGALNDKKVLWLRDSFGTSLSPLMSITFKEVLQEYWMSALKPDGNFAKLVEDFKPDYVFITVVERNARDQRFTAYPPGFIAQDANFKTFQTAKLTRLNHLLTGPSANEYQINGRDPYVDFTLSSSAQAAAPQHLSLDIRCADSSASVPVQLFWLEDGQSSYDEAHSTKLVASTGRTTLALDSIPKWPANAAIKRLRIDIDATKTCRKFTLNSPKLGTKIK